MLPFFLQLLVQALVSTSASEALWSFTIPLSIKRNRVETTAATTINRDVYFSLLYFGDSFWRKPEKTF